MAADSRRNYNVKSGTTDCEPQSDTDTTTAKSFGNT